jgi:hypothetical protein
VPQKVVVTRKEIMAGKSVGGDGGTVDGVKMRRSILLHRTPLSLLDILQH